MPKKNHRHAHCHDGGVIQQHSYSVNPVAAKVGGLQIQVF